MAVKAIACELPATLGVPLSRLHVPDVRRQVLSQGLVADISGATIWRWLSDDAIKPWTHRSWIFPRDPNFEAKAGRVLDLYHRSWQGKPLTNDEYVISADEKTSIQARIRLHPTSPPGSGQPARVEHEYQRGGGWRIWRPGRCTKPTCSAAANPPPVSLPLHTLSNKSWQRNPTPRHGGSPGWSTTAPPTVGKPPSSG